jgi:multidrug efflux pump subunit AcrB
VLVQNRVQQAVPMLPDVVKNTGVTVKKKSPSILLVVNLYSDVDPATKEPYYDQLYLSNYATIQVKDQLARIDGVGDVTLLGQQDYSMRVWLDPNRLAARNLTATDVVTSLREQNVQVAAGQLGQPPVTTGVDFQYTKTTIHDDHARPVDRARAIRRHRGQDGRQGRDDSLEGRRPNRAGC